MRWEDNDVSNSKKKEQLADKIFLMDVKAERVAKTCMPGQFIIVK